MNLDWTRRLLLAALILVPIQSNAVTPMIAVGENHVLALKNDGSFVAWGDDSHGQLGLGRVMHSSTPSQVPGLNGVVLIGAGGGHSLALKQDGTAWAWGHNAYGQLGDGSTTDRSSPVAIPGLTGVYTFAAGSNHSVALKQDGTVWAWGFNGFGELGNGTTINRSTPTQVTGLTGVVAIAAGADHTIALRQDGTIWAWGLNGHGQLGDGTTTNRSIPVPVAGTNGVVAIAAKYNFNLALRQDGTVWAWGDNAYGQLGQGDAFDRYTPVQVFGSGGAVAIAAGLGHAVALRQDRTVWAWGYGGFGQLGNGTNFNLSLPTQVPGMTGVYSIAAGLYQTVVLRQDGTVWAWGEDFYGQLGDGTNSFARNTPVPVQGLTAVTAIVAGELHTLALRQDGTVFAWGDNSYGQLGDGATAIRSIPVQAPGSTGVIAVAAGGSRSLALKQDGTVLSWGDYIPGIGTPAPTAGLTGIVAIAQGYAHSLALNQGGVLWSWGENSSGQLGDGTTTSRYTPMQVPGLSGITAAAAGNWDSLALKQDGTLLAWGDNISGQLGFVSSGSCLNSFSGNALPCQLTPAISSGLAGVVAIASGFDHTLALKQDGTVWASGDNRLGQLGDGTSVSRSSPMQVKGITGVIAVVAGFDHSLALKQDGTVWAWGSNTYGQLGDGTLTNRYTPVQVQRLSGAIAIAAGLHFSFALRQDGSILGWGSNNIGQLGDGTFAQHRTPALVVNETATGYLDLTPNDGLQIQPGAGVPFFVVASGGITDTSASVSTTTKFNAPDVGKQGAVYVTAAVPQGTLAPVASGPTVLNMPRPSVLAGVTPTTFVLVQLTASGWQQVVNGQLIPYASGVLGDQLAAQTILNGTDTTNLAGAQFCVGYGASANQMIAAGTIRTVATIPDPNATTSSTVSCMVGGAALSYSVQVSSGWSLLGNSLNQNLTVATLYNDPSTVNTVWKWDPVNANWQFFTPLMDAATLQAYVAGKGYSVLSDIKPGEGYWVNAKSQSAPSTQSGNSFILTSTNLVTGWNLSATGNDVTPSLFNTYLKSSLPGTGVTTLWAWDNPSSRWYFYSPSLEAQGGTALTDYIAGKGYLDFTSNNKTLGNGTGFWVNRP